MADWNVFDFNPRVRNEEVVEAFLRGFAARSHNNNLRTDGFELVNYSTLIATRLGRSVVLNAQKYSKTTSRIQNLVRYKAKEMGYDLMEVNHEPGAASI